LAAIGLTPDRGIETRLIALWSLEDIIQRLLMAPLYNGMVPQSGIWRNTPSGIRLRGAQFSGSDRCANSCLACFAV
jgi:hypothetical protein